MESPYQSFLDVMKEKKPGTTDIHSVALTEKQEREGVELAMRLFLQEHDENRAVAFFRTAYARAQAV